MSDFSSAEGSASSGDDDDLLGPAKRRRGRMFDRELSDEEFGHYRSNDGLAEEEEIDGEFAPRMRGRKRARKKPSSASHVRFVSSVKPEEPPASEESRGSASKTNEDFRRLVETASVKESPSAPIRKKMQVEVSKEIGSWEKHTKGFGAKMLSKFGFSGRLGAREDGVSQAIEVAVRPVGVGLGFGGITEASALPSNKKIEAEWRGVEYKETVNEELPLKSQSWRKGRSRKEIKKLSAVELLMQQAMEDSAEVRVSRGAEVEEASRSTVTREVETLQRTAKPELGKELLYNLNTMHEAVELEARSLSSKLHSVLIRSKALGEEVAALSMKAEADAGRLDRLERVTALVGRVNDKIRNDPSSVSVEALCGVFVSLLDAFSEEFFVFGMINLVPLFARPLLSHRIQSWRPLDEPCLILDILKPWTSLEEIFSFHEKSILGQQAHEMIVDTLQTLSLPALRRALVTDWNLQTSNASCALLVKSIQSIFDIGSVNELLEQSVLPKLQKAIADWTPTVSSTLHVSIQEWIPVLGSKLSSLFPEIRRKISHALSNWDGVNRLGITLVKPWQGYFDEGSFNNLLFRVIIPKLITALRSFVINPQNQSIDVIQAVLSWHKVIPQINLCALLAGEFFPKWLHVLYLWLSTSPDFEEVSEWYAGWRSLFPEDIAEDNLVKTQFNMALDMMESSLSGAELRHPYDGKTGVQANSYLSIMERIHSEEKTQKRLAELQNKSMRVKAVSLASFKDVVEEFATSRGIEFVPQLGRLHADKQLWLFGGRSIYFDQNVVFMYSAESKSWSPIGLEDLAATVGKK